MVPVMGDQRVMTAAEMELLSPGERARVVRDAQRSSLADLDPDFRARVEETSRRIAEEHGLLNADQS